MFASKPDNSLEVLNGWRSVYQFDVHILYFYIQEEGSARVLCCVTQDFFFLRVQL